MALAFHSWPGQPPSGERVSSRADRLRHAVEPLARLASSAQTQPTLVPPWDDVGASVTLASSQLLALLERLYVLPQRERTLTFIERKPHLVLLLLEAYTVIHWYFHGVRLVLRPVESEEDGTEQLGLYIVVPQHDPDDAIARLAALDEEWWLDAMDRAFGELFITVTAA